MGDQFGQEFLPGTVRKIFFTNLEFLLVILLTLHFAAVIAGAICDEIRSYVDTLLRMVDRHVMTHEIPVGAVDGCRVLVGDATCRRTLAVVYRSFQWLYSTTLQ